MTRLEKDWAERFGRFGHIARGIVFGLIGVFLIQAALTFDPNKAQGFDGALLKLAQSPFGPVLLGLVAVGLITFGIYSVLNARWAKVL